jgi:hypothetical protein
MTVHVRHFIFFFEMNTCTVYVLGVSSSTVKNVDLHYAVALF